MSLVSGWFTGSIFKVHVSFLMTCRRLVAEALCLAPVALTDSLRSDARFVALSRSAHATRFVATACRRLWLDGLGFLNLKTNKKIIKFFALML